MSVEGDFGVSTGFEERIIFNDGPSLLDFPEGVSVAYINGTDSLELPEQDYETPTATSAWDDELDHEEIDKAYKATQPPGGYYDVAKFEGTETVKAVEYWVKTGEGFEKVTQERPILRYSGRGRRDVEGKVYEPRISFRISPVRAYGKNEDGSVNPDKFDSPYKLFCRALLAYEQVLGVKPKTGRALREYLESYPTKIRTMQGSDGLVVLDIVGVKV